MGLRGPDNHACDDKWDSTKLDTWVAPF